MRSRIQNRLLVLSNSYDGTANTLVELCNQRNIEVMRWNMDLWPNYEVSAGPDGYFISDGHNYSLSINEANFCVIWRKPFVRISHLENSNPEIDFALEQLRIFLRSLSQELIRFRCLKLVNPFHEITFTKLLQLQIARGVFSVPDWEFNTMMNPKDGKDKIVKAIGYPKLLNGTTLFSTYVSPDDLQRPYPWFLQDPIIGGRDVTCVFILGKMFWYECEFTRDSKSIDWRVEIQTERESKWFPLEIAGNSKLASSVVTYMGASGLAFGRLDFIRDPEDNYWFLECNVNGEFGWLDDENLTLHNCYLNAILSSDSAIGTSSIFSFESN